MLLLQAKKKTFSTHNGLFSINALRQRPFLSNGALIDAPYDITDGWDKPDLRCTTIGCSPPTPKLIPMQSTDSGVGVVCAGK